MFKILCIEILVRPIHLLTGLFNYLPFEIDLKA